jgi:hypothetical protein
MAPARRLPAREHFREVAVLGRQIERAAVDLGVGREAEHVPFVLSTFPTNCRIRRSARTRTRIPPST